ncbi:WD40 repeat domain-containing protein [Pseudomonas anguilliseptica]|uniref:WD40 repeat domain-containing protein n=1 Tax=Pseudomonas anguilliseptica TaxID=53406 RepID=UPI0022AF6435|nr:hypothetical protein [Pseudomonas anguilliseptica]MCZ4324618.1 hypothetical protein [Pseudomonas anguilliseptica]
MQNTNRKQLFVIAAVSLLLGAGYLLWHYVLFPPIHSEFSQALFKQRFAGEDRATSMRYHDGGKYLAIGMESGVIHLWDATQRETRLSMRAHQHRVSQLQFSRDGKQLFSNSYFESVTQLWDSKSGAHLASIADARGPVAQAPHKNLYLIANDDEFILYDLHKRQALPERYKAGESITALASNSTKSLIAVGTASGSIQLWQFNEQQGQLQAVLKQKIKPYATGNWLLALRFSADGQNLISANREGTVSEWRSANLSKLRDIPSTLRWVHQATFSEHSPWLSLAGTLDPSGGKAGKVELIDLTKGEALRFPARSNYAVAEMVSPLKMGLIAHGRRITGATLD